MDNSNLAHSIGSRDKNIHITTAIRNANGDLIKTPRHGNPKILDAKRHVYTNPKDKQNGGVVLPKVYKDAVKAKQISKHGHFIGI